ncbi:caspase-3-like [Aethina tumida]|uniref:caspase-3-like n=1 Tax=Aethina tumida TaxID=116153 RepID=UPI002147E1A6|nr:caspase-3-like [Aethina tumida]
MRRNDKGKSSDKIVVKKSCTLTSQQTRTLQYSEQTIYSSNTSANWNRNGSSALFNTNNSFSTYPSTVSSLFGPINNTDRSQIINLTTAATDARPFSSQNGTNSVPAVKNLQYQSVYKRPSYPGVSQTSTVINKPAYSGSSPPISKPIIVSANPRPSISSVTSQVSQSSGLPNDHEIPTYNTKGKNRAKVLIINNILFKGKEERKGAKKDTEALEKLCKKFKLEYTSKKDLKKDEMIRAVNDFAKSTSQKNYNMVITIIMSHGTSIQDSHGQITQISGIDEKLIQVKEITDIIALQKHLSGKPKIFIFQCCRGEEVHTDARPIISNAKNQSDMLLAYSTLPGFVSYRSPTTGSWYIQTLCSIFSAHAHQWDIETMLKKVDAEMKNKYNKEAQTSCYDCRGFKRCFLFQD